MIEKYQWEEGWICPVCKQARGPDLHDPCLGALPGVKFACCGHGGSPQSMPYLYFENGVRLDVTFNSIDYEDGRARLDFPALKKFIKALISAMTPTKCGKE